MPDFNRMQRQRLAAKNQAMPDGGFPIRNIADLKNAIQAYGRAKNKPAVKAWIKKRARELGALDLLPENWRDNTLVHYGVKGMKWGVRKEERSGGDYVLKKGSRFGRVALTPSDWTYDNKKYLSTSKEDQEKWEDYLGSRYAQRGRDTYNIGYEAVKDIKIMSGTKSGMKFVEMMMDDKDFAQQAVKDVKWAMNNFALTDEIPDDPAEQLSYAIAAQTKTGKDFAQRIIQEGYGGVEDVHGRNVSENPVIVYDPDRNLKKTSIDRTKY